MDWRGGGGNSRVLGERARRKGGKKYCSGMKRKKGKNNETRKILIKIMMVSAKHAPGTFENVLYLQ